MLKETFRQARTVYARLVHVCADEAAGLVAAISEVSFRQARLEFSSAAKCRYMTKYDDLDALATKSLTAQRLLARRTYDGRFSPWCGSKELITKPEIRERLSLGDATTGRAYTN
jgi:hypothetical protein